MDHRYSRPLALWMVAAGAATACASCGEDNVEAPAGSDGGSCPSGGCDASHTCVDCGADPCAGVGCSGHGACAVDGGAPACACDKGYRAEGLSCVADPAQCGTLTFSGDWETGLVTGSGDRNWAHKEVVNADRIRIVDDGAARQGRYYARVEVRPGEDGWGGGGGKTERAEVASMQDAAGQQIYENDKSGTVQYTVSVKLDASWQAPDWGIFLQLHGDNATNPDWAMTAEDRFGFNERFCLHPNVTSHAFTNGGGDLSIGKWVDFVITIKYALDATGWVVVRRRTEGETAYTEVLNMQNTCTLQPPDLNSGNHYMKHGYYRSASSFTTLLSLDGFTRRSVTADCPFLGR